MMHIRALQRDGVATGDTAGRRASQPPGQASAHQTSPTTKALQSPERRPQSHLAQARGRRTAGLTGAPWQGVHRLEETPNTPGATTLQRKGRHREPAKHATSTNHLHAQGGAFRKVTTPWRRRRPATEARVFTWASEKGGGREDEPRRRHQGGNGIQNAIDAVTTTDGQGFPPDMLPAATHRTSQRSQKARTLEIQAYRGLSDACWRGASQI